MTSSSNCRSVLVVGVIFLIACGSMAYISYFSGEDHEEIIVARIKELELSTEFANKNNRNYDEELRLRSGEIKASSSIEGETYFSTERKSIIDCENMVPIELESPRFLGSIPNITARVGDNVSIPCVAENLGSYRMAWLKLPSQTIMTIHNHIITKNRRIGLSMESQTLETPCKNRSVETTIMMYTLNIDSVQKKDESIYMCQLNTDPMKGQWGFLKVETPPSEGSQDLTFSSSENVFGNESQFSIS